MYYLSVEFSSTTDMSISYLFILLSSPIILYIYTKGMKKYKLKTTTFYNVDIYLKNKILKLTGFMDTGNTLLDPYKKRKVIITKNKEIKEYINENNFFLVPYESVSTHGLLKCIKVDKIYIESLGLKRNIVIGFTEDFKIDADCILNYLLMEE